MMKITTYVSALIAMLPLMAGCGSGPVFIYTETATYTDSERVRVRVDATLSKPEAETIMQRLQEMTGARERAVTTMTEPRGTTWFDLAPVTNIQALASAINFGHVEAITGRVIVVTLPKK